MEEKNALHRISASEFIAIWEGKYRRIKGYEHYYTKSGTCYFHDTLIEGNIEASDKKELAALKLSSCVIENIKIINCETISLELINTSITQELSIVYEKINNKTYRIPYIAVSKDSSVGKISFKNCDIELFTIENADIKKLWYDSSEVAHSIIDNSKIVSFQIFNNTKIVDIQISQSILEYIFFTSSYINHISITNNTKINKIRFNDKLIANFIEIKYNSDITELQLLNSHIYNFATSNSSFNSIITGGSKFYKFELINLIQIYNFVDTNSYFELFKISSQRFTSLLFKESIFYSLDVTDGQIPKDANIIINNSGINQFKISNCLFSGIMRLNSIEPLKKITRFVECPNGPFVTDYKDFDFYQAQEQTLFRIEDSDLGKAQFINCNIKGFDKFEIKSSRILETFIANTELPTKESILYPENQKQGNNDEHETQNDIDKLNTLKLEQQRLALSQFKKIYENRGDNIRATQALAEEIETYRAQLKLEKPTTKKERWNNKTERFNLWLNRTSNYHGNNWFRAATVTILINWLLFYLYSLSLGFRFGGDWNMFGKLFASSFDFLNPVHKTDFLVDRFDFTLKIGGLALFIDNISRIIIAYLVYQTIAAFRKFGKKSG